MKNFILLTLSILLLTGCYSPDIYKPNRIWKFQIVFNDIETNDFISLKSYDELFGMQIKSEWEYTFKNDDNIHYISEITGIVENNRKDILSLLRLVSQKVWIHPPRPSIDFYRLRHTELVPFPYVEFPLKIGNNSPWELTLKEGWKDWEGVEVKGNITVADKVFNENKNVNDSCWVIDAYGNSRIGKYSATYLFNEKKGFVNFKYYINKDTIELKLYEINF